MLRLEIVTPEKRVVDAEVDSVTVPTVSGEAGIMASHAPLVSAIKPGVLTYAAKGQIERFAVSSGFVEVNSDKVAVLVDVAERVDEIDLETARSDRDAAERELAAAVTSSLDENVSLRESAEHAAARVQVASGR